MKRNNRSAALASLIACGWTMSLSYATAQDNAFWYPSAQSNGANCANNATPDFDSGMSVPVVQITPALPWGGYSNPLPLPSSNFSYPGAVPSMSSVGPVYSSPVETSMAWDSIPVGSVDSSFPIANMYPANLPVDSRETPSNSILYGQVYPQIYNLPNTVEPGLAPGTVVATDSIVVLLPPVTGESIGENSPIVIAPIDRKLADTNPSPSDIRPATDENGAAAVSAPSETEVALKQELIELKKQLGEAVERARAAEQRVFAAEKSANAAEQTSGKMVDSLSQKIAAMEAVLEVAQQKADQANAQQEAARLKIREMAELESKQAIEAKREAEEAERNAKMDAETTAKSQRLDAAKAAENKRKKSRRLANSADDSEQNRDTKTKPAEKVPATAESKPASSDDDSASQSSEKSALIKEKIKLLEALKQEKMAESRTRISQRFANQKKRMIDSGKKESSRDFKELAEKLETELKKSDIKIEQDFEAKIAVLKKDLKTQADK